MIKKIYFLTLLLLQTNISAMNIQPYVEEIDSANTAKEKRELKTSLKTKKQTDEVYKTGTRIGGPLYLANWWVFATPNTRKSKLDEIYPFALTPNQQTSIDLSQLQKATNIQTYVEEIDSANTAKEKRELKTNLKTKKQTDEVYKTGTRIGGPLYLANWWVFATPNTRKSKLDEIYPFALTPNQQTEFFALYEGGRNAFVAKYGEPVEKAPVEEAPGTQTYFDQQQTKIANVTLNNDKQYQGLSVELEGKYWNNMKELFVLFRQNKEQAISGNKDAIVNVYDGYVRGLGIGALNNEQQRKQVIGDIVNMLTTPTKGGPLGIAQDSFLDWMNVILCVSGRTPDEQGTTIPESNRKTRIEDTLLYGTVAMAMVSAIKENKVGYTNANVKIDLNKINTAEKDYIKRLPVYQ